MIRNEMESSTSEVNPDAMQNEKLVVEEASNITKPSSSANYARQLVYVFFYKTVVT